MAGEIEMGKLEELCSRKTPAIDLEELLRQATTKEFMENFFEEELDEENMMLIKMLNLTARTLKQIHEQDLKIELLKTDVNELQAKVAVLEIEVEKEIEKRARG